MELLSVFNPSMQVQVCRDITRAHVGNAPTLGLVRKAYGRHVAESWLETQLADLSEFAGCKDKITPAQREEMAAIILDDFGYLKVTQLMVFFQQVKRGVYGKFYGAVDPMQTMAALRDFRDECNNFIIQEDKRRENMLKMRNTAMYDGVKQRYRDRITDAYTKNAKISYLQYQLLGMDEMDDEQLTALQRWVNEGSVKLPTRAEELIKYKTTMLTTNAT